MQKNTVSLALLILLVATSCAHSPMLDFMPTIVPTPDFDTLIKDDPDNPELYLARAGNYFAGGAYDRAVSDYSQTIKLAPDNALAYVGRGNAYAQSGKYDLALSDYDQAARLAPDLQLHYDRGLAYVGKNDVEHAIAEFTIEIERPWPLPGIKVTSPPYAAAARGYCQRGFVYAKINESEKATTDLKQCIDYSQHIPAYADLLRQAEDTLKLLESK